MKILNKEEVDTFCWEHRENGVWGVKGLVNGELINIAWMDMITGEEVEIIYG